MAWALKGTCEVKYAVGAHRHMDGYPSPKDCLFDLASHCVGKSTGKKITDRCLKIDAIELKSIYKLYDENWSNDKLKSVISDLAASGKILIEGFNVTVPMESILEFYEEK